MLETLASGKLYGKPQERASRDGARTFVTAKLRCSGGDGESLFVGVVAFSDTAKAALLALDDGEPVALAGTLRAGVWTAANGESRAALDMVAHSVLTAYHVQRRRKAVQASERRDEPVLAGGFDDPIDAI
ncbi:MAG TPA: single-stranded DNA-binding protein [Paraburkholderia sp.]|jgi:single-stranded DNA-binding protein